MPLTHDIAATPAKPIVILPACRRAIDGMPYHVVASKYLEAVRLAGCRPLIVPFADKEELDALLALADGVLLTGSPSNVHPSHFGQVIHDPAEPLDELRDAWTLPAIPRILDAGLPLLAICRGMQELNVALGGSLHQAVHELPGRQDHRTPKNPSEEIQYGPVHPVGIAPGGLLESVLERQRIEVNSLHGQAIDLLGAGLAVEATASDGVIEAVSCPRAAGFALGVQWHPEWRASENPHSLRILRAFGSACAAHRQKKHGPEP